MIMGSFDRIATETVRDHEVALPVALPLAGAGTRAGPVRGTS